MKESDNILYMLLILISHPTRSTSHPSYSICFNFASHCIHHPTTSNISSSYFTSFTSHSIFSDASIVASICNTTVAITCSHQYSIDSIPTDLSTAKFLPCFLCVSVVLPRIALPSRSVLVILADCCFPLPHVDVSLAFSSG